MREPKDMALGKKALELIMRDVLDGLEDLALEASHDVRSGQFEIIAIEPPGKTEHGQTDRHPAKQRCTRGASRRGTADIVSFIEERERIALLNGTTRRKAAC